MNKESEDSKELRVSWASKVQEKLQRVWLIELDFPKKIISRQSVFLVVLLVVIILSSLSVVYSAHYSRGLFHELKLAKQQRDSLETEWGQLLLEQSALSAHTRVEQVAIKYLSLSLPEAENIKLVMSHGR